MNYTYIEDTNILMSDIISNLEIITNDLKELHLLLIKLLKESK